MPTTTNSKLPYPAPADPADVPADMQKLAVALDEIAYAEATSNVSITATTQAAANTVVTSPSVTLDGTTPIVVEFYAMSVVPGTSVFIVSLFEDGIARTTLAFINKTAGQAFTIPIFVATRFTTSAGAHTYSIRCNVDGGTGTVNAGGLNAPAFIRIRRA